MARRDAPLSADLLAAMKYTKQVALEALRLRPPAPMVPHIAAVDYPLTPHYTVPKGTIVFPSVFDASFQVSRPLPPHAQQPPRPTALPGPPCCALCAVRPDIYARRSCRASLYRALTRCMCGVQGFTEPHRFDPDRFSEERREDVRFKRNWLLFGAGPHQCLGQRYAINHIMVSARTTAGPPKGQPPIECWQKPRQLPASVMLDARSLACC